MQSVRQLYDWLRNRPDFYVLACWLILGTSAGYQRVAFQSWCSDSTSSVLASKSPQSFPCNGSAIARSFHVIKYPIQVYRDLLWDSPNPIRWVQGQILAVIVRFLAVILLPPALYRIASPWLVAASRAVAPACLVAGSWWPALEALWAGRGASGSAGAKLDSSGSHAFEPGDEYIEFSLRWYPLMDIAFTYIHPTSMVVEAVYGIFSASCVLMMGLPGLPGKRLPRGFFLPHQLAKCVLSTLALLAIERWRLLHVQSSGGGGRSGEGSSGGSGGGASCVRSPGGSGAGVAALTSKGFLEVEGEEAAAASRVGDTLAGGGDGGAVGCGGGVQEDEVVEAGGRGVWNHKEQHEPLQEQERPQRADSRRADPPRTNELRLVAAETRRLSRYATRSGSGSSGSGGGAGVSSGGGSSGGGGWVRLDPHDRRDQRQSLHPQLRAVHQLGTTLPGMPPADDYPPQPDGEQPAPQTKCLPAGAAAAAAVVEQQQVSLNARPLPPYVPHRARFQSAILGTQRDGPTLLQTGVPDISPLLLLPASPSGLQQQPGEAVAPATETAGAQVRHQGQLLDSHHMAYTSRTTLYSTRIKLDGCEPEQVAPGYRDRISQVVAAAGMQLEAVTLRRGCIELIIETRAVDAALGLAQGPVTLPGSHPQQTLATAADSAGAAAASAGVPSAAGGESSSDCRSTRGPGSSLWEGRSESTICADAAPADAFDDMLDIGALIRALQLPDASSLEFDLAPASEEEHHSSPDNGGALEGAGEGFCWAEAGAPGAEGGEAAAALGAAMATADVTGAWRDGLEARNVDGGAWAVADPRVGNWVGGGVDARRSPQGRQQAGRQRVAAVAAAAASNTGLRPVNTGASRQVLLPYVLDVYPRVLLVGPASGCTLPPGLQPLQHAAQQAPQQAAAAATAINTTTLVVVVSWVTSSPARVPEPPGLAAASTTAPMGDPRAGRACSSPRARHEGSSTTPTGAAPPGATVGAAAAATAAEAPGAAGLDISDSGPQTHGTVAAAAEAAAVRPHAVLEAAAPQPSLSMARILLSSHGEVVAVAVVAPSAAAAAATMTVPAAELSPPPPPLIPTALGGGFESASTLDAGGGGGGGGVNECRSPWAETEALAVTANGGGGGGFGAAEGSGAPLGSEALYSVDAGPLLSQMLPGVLLVEANRDMVSQPEAAVAVVPVLTVDDPRVALELQQALDSWYGTADELDNLLYDMGALIRLQDDLTACAGAAAGGGGGGTTLLHLSALSARTQILYNHLVWYAEAMCWDAARAWLRARQQAAAVAVAAANAAAAAPPPPSSAGSVRCATTAGSLPVTGPVVVAAATAAATASSPEGLELAETAEAPLPPAGAAPAQIDNVYNSRRGSSSSGHIGSVGRLVGPSSFLRRLLRLLRLALGWQSEGEADAAAYAAHAALFAASTMNVMQVMDLTCLLAAFMICSTAPPQAAASGADVTTRGGGPKFGGPWLHADQACVLVAASTGVLTGALRLVLPRPVWRRIATHVKWPRQVSYTLAKVMVAFLGFPQSPWTARHELGASVFLVEGILIPAAALMTPMESVVLALVRAPLCVHIWLLAGDSNHNNHQDHHQHHDHHQYTVLAASLRALALSGLSVLTTVAVHMYIRMSYEWRRRRAAAPHAKVE